MFVTPRWSRKKSHSPLLAILLVVFISCSILYNEFSIQQIHESSDHGFASSTQRTSFTIVKLNLPNGASDSVVTTRLRATVGRSSGRIRMLSRVDDRVQGKRGVMCSPASECLISNRTRFIKSRTTRICQTSWLVISMGKRKKTRVD
ncbi:hypothetical protein V6N13_078242 [Hibiscus sabdariffa]|uniref:Uncharacterized protein n=1 Tax=Hibiscus sabdariffa TaxID=183260 RepID=A0ABR2RNI2_9ROSI